MSAGYNCQNHFKISCMQKINKQKTLCIQGVYYNLPINTHLQYAIFIYDYAMQFGGGAVAKW